MKKALDYVSDYQLHVQPACIVTCRVAEKIFCCSRGL